MMSWECRRETLAEDKNMGISSLKMIFKAMGRGEITNESRVREGKQLGAEPPAFGGQAEEDGATQPAG